MTPDQLTTALQTIYGANNPFEVDAPFGECAGTHPRTVRRWRTDGRVPGPVAALVNLMLELKNEQTGRKTAT